MILISYDHRGMSTAILEEADNSIIAVMEGRGFTEVGSGASWNRRDLEFTGRDTVEEMNFLEDEDAHDELARMVGEVYIVMEGSRV